MRRKHSAQTFSLQPPAGFQSSSQKTGIILSDGSLMKRDGRGLYLLDNAHRHLLPNFIARPHSSLGALTPSEFAALTPEQTTPPQEGELTGGLYL